MSGFNVIVRGAHELEAAFEDVKVKVDPTVGKTLSSMGRQVRQTAQQLAVANVRNIGPNWSQMKSGRKRVGVYVAEKQHRAGGWPRPNLANLLMARALMPAVKQREAEIVAAVDIALAELCRLKGTL